MALVRSSKGNLYDPEDPASKASHLGLDLDTYAASRLIASEGYGGPKPEKPLALTGIIWAAKNVAKKRVTTLAKVLLKSSDPEANGHFGEQHGRWASTRIEPKPYHIEIAQRVMLGQIPDPTGGATGFLDASVWEKGLQAGRKLRPLAEILMGWAGEKMWTGPVAGITTAYLAFFKPSFNKSKNQSSMQTLLVEAKKGLKIGIPVAGLLALLGAGLWYFMERG